MARNRLINLIYGVTGHNMLCPYKNPRVSKKVIHKKWAKNREIFWKLRLFSKTATVVVDEGNFQNNEMTTVKLVM